MKTLRMPKLVIGGQDAGDQGIGNGSPLAGQNSGPAAKLSKGEKGKEKMQGAGGEMVVGDRVATRSVSREKRTRQDLQSSSESDELLFAMFKEWAIKLRKHYKTAEEEKERFKIWCSTKELYDNLNSRGARLGLSLFADLTVAEQGRFFMKPSFPVPQETPTIHAGLTKLAVEHNKMKEKRDAEDKEAFDKWAAEQMKNYGSELERKAAFALYQRNMRWIKSLMLEDPVRYSTSLNVLGILLDQVLTLSEVKSLLTGCTAELLLLKD